MIILHLFFASDPGFLGQEFARLLTLQTLAPCYFFSTWRCHWKGPILKANEEHDNTAGRWWPKHNCQLKNSCYVCGITKRLLWRRLGLKVHWTNYFPPQLWLDTFWTAIILCINYVVPKARYLMSLCISVPRSKQTPVNG